MTKNILKPVTYIIKESEKINAKNLNIKLPKIRDDEIGDLIDVINNLFTKKQLSGEEKQAFDQEEQLLSFLLSNKSLIYL